MKRVYLTDEQGNKVPLLDRDGNQRFSKYNNQPLYRYNDVPIPPVEPNVKEKAYLVNHDTAASFHAAVENTLQNVSDPGQRDLRAALASMMVAAETNNKATVGDGYSMDREDMLQALHANKKEFSNAVYDASCIVKEYKNLAWEAAKQHKAEPVKNSYEDDIPFGPMPENLVHNTVEPIEGRPQSAEKVQVEKAALEADMAKSPAIIFSENLAKSLFDSMKAIGASDGEMLLAFAKIKDQGLKMVQENIESKVFSR